MKSGAVAIRVNYHFKIVSPHGMAMDLHFLFFGCSAPAFVIVEKIGRRLESNIIKKGEVFWCRLPVAVRRFLVVKNAERFVGVTFVFQPVEGSLGNNFGAVTFLSHPLTFNKKIGIVVLTLSRQNHGKIESLGDAVEVNFPNHGSLVAIGLH